MEPIKTFQSRTVVLPSTNIDTDQIIPARFLRTTVRTGLGKQLFSDWRYSADGTPKADFPLNQPTAQGCEILVAGRNFGCGSSREHAPWALIDFGFKAVISAEIADIFRSNALRNGLLAIVIDEPKVNWLLANPGVTVTVDLENNVVTLPNAFGTSGNDARTNAVHFQIERFARYCLLNGVDELGYVRSQETAIARFEDARRERARA